MDAAMNYNLIESMRSDRDKLVDEVTRLTTSLAEKEKECKKLSSEAKSSSEIKSELTKILSEYLSISVERLIATTKRDASILQQGQENIVVSLSEILVKIKQSQVESESHKEMILPEHKKLRSPKESEVSIENLDLENP